MFALPDAATRRAIAARHGVRPDTWPLLGPGFAYAPVDADAVVPYVDTGRAWIAAGPPIAAADRHAAIAAATAAAARRAGRALVWFAVDDAFVARLGADACAFAVGAEPWWDAACWAANLAGHRSLREQLRRARAKGVRVRAVDAAAWHAPAMQAALEHVRTAWLARRRMAPLEFVVRVDVRAVTADARAFVAERDGVVVAFAVAWPAPASASYLVRDLVRAPDAPSGTSELLIDAVMRHAAPTGALVSLGMVPLAPHAGALDGWLQTVRRATRPLYDFDGLAAFRGRLRPTAWAPVAVASPTPRAAPLVIGDVLAAFAGGSLARFGWRSLRRLQG